MVKGAVHVVDDDEAVRESLAALLESAGYKVATFADGPSFLAAERASDGEEGCACALVDVRMPGMTGIELLASLAHARTALPVIIMTGHGDVPLAVRAMKAGAVDFIEKPFSDDFMLAAVERALERAQGEQATARLAAEARSRLDGLTPRERDVLDQIVIGHPNKVIAQALEISPRTVEVHRSRVMEKMGAKNLPHLIRLAMAVGITLE